MGMKRFQPYCSTSFDLLKWRFSNAKILPSAELSVFALPTQGGIAFDMAMTNEEEIRAEVEELGRLTEAQEDILYNIAFEAGRAWTRGDEYVA